MKIKMIKREVELYADKENHLFPIFNESDVANAAKYFALASNKKEVASAINDRANKLGMKIEANKISDFRRFCAKDILVGDDFAKKTCLSAEDVNKSISDEDDLEERIEKFEKNYFKYRKGYNYINSIINSDALFYFCLMMDLYDVIKADNTEEEIIDAFHKAVSLFCKTETTINTKKFIPLLYSSLNITPKENDESNINNNSFDDIIGKKKLKRTIKFTLKECEKMKEEMELNSRFRDKTQKLNNFLTVSNIDNSIDILRLASEVARITEERPKFLICGGVPCKTELSGPSLLMYKRISTTNRFTGNYYTKTIDYDSNNQCMERKFYFLMKDNQMILVVTDLSNENLYLIYIDENNPEKPSKVTKVKISVPETNKLMESFTIDEDGSVKIELTRSTNLMDEYDSNHKRIKEAYKNNNLEEVKLLLAYDFALLDRIEHDLNNKKLTKAKREELVKARQFLMNDFKSYLRLVTKKEPKFNFTKYYDSCDEIKRFFVVDKKTINGIKTLLRNILL